MITFGLIAVFAFCFFYFAVFDRYDIWAPVFLAGVIGVFVTIIVSACIPTTAVYAPPQEMNMLAGATYAYLDTDNEEIVVLLTDNESSLELFKTIDVSQTTIVYSDVKEPTFQTIKHEVKNKLFFWGINNSTEYVITIPSGTLTPLG